MIEKVLLQEETKLSLYKMITDNKGLVVSIRLNVNHDGQTHDSSTPPGHNYDQKLNMVR